MKKSQAARLTQLHRVQTFLDANAAALGTISKSTSRTDLDLAVTGLEQFAAQQSRAEAAAVSYTQEKADARDELRIGHMQPITAIARKKFGNTPAMQKLALPHKSTGDVALIAAGTGMAEACAQYQQVFLDQQMPADFIAQLQAAVKAVQDAVNAQAKARLDVNESTKGVKAQLSITHTDVKVLNGLVVKQLKSQPGLLGAWTNAKRVYAKAGVPTGTTTAPVITAVPVPTPVATPVPVPAPAAQVIPAAKEVSNADAA
ncbi:MAG: hypothetical protein ACHQQ3_07460 [Gemmatimonadales bacterium]